MAVAGDIAAMSDKRRDEASTDQTAYSREGSSEDDRTPNTLLNALIGGVVGVLLSFIPFSTVLGGGVAGYLEGGDSEDGAKVGGLAGLVAFVPFVAIIAVVLLVVPVAPGPGGGAQVAVWVTVLLIALAAAVYTVGLSVLGGVLGVYLKENR